MASIGREDIIGSDQFLSGAIGLRLPGNLNTGLEFLHILTAGKDAALRNWADGKLGATLIGAPVEHTGYLSLASGANYLRTAAKDEFPRASLLVVSRDTGTPSGSNADNFLHVGSYNGTGAQTGMSIYSAFGSAAEMAATARYISGSTGQSAGQRLASVGWRARLATAGDSSDDMYFHDLTAAVTASSDIAAGYARQNNGAPFVIGSANVSAFGGTGDVALAALWSRILTSDERAAIYDWAKRLCASVSLTV